MPCGREGNRRSNVALAMRHRLQWFIYIRAHGLDREMSKPPALLVVVVEYGIFSFSLAYLMYRLAR